MKRKKQQAVIEKDKELHDMERSTKRRKPVRKSRLCSWRKKIGIRFATHKSQEMANLMINFVRKNEMLTEIKSGLLKVSALLKVRGSGRKTATHTY